MNKPQNRKLRPITSSNQLRRAAPPSPAGERLYPPGTSTHNAPARTPQTPAAQSDAQLSEETASQVESFVRAQAAESAGITLEGPGYSDGSTEEAVEPKMPEKEVTQTENVMDEDEMLDLAQQLQMRGPYDNPKYRALVMKQSEELSILDAITGRAQRTYVINENLKITVQQVYSGEELLIRNMMSDALNQMEQYYQALYMVRTLAVGLVSINDMQFSDGTHVMSAYTREDIDAAVERLSTVPRNLITLVGTVHAWHVGEVEKILTPSSVKNG